MDIFYSDYDRDGYLQLIADGISRAGVSVWAWCLMTNHVHFLMVPEKETSLALSLKEATRRHARRINERHGVRGHLFQERFYSYPVQTDRHLAAVARYIEQNPVKAGLVLDAENYPWSSASFNIGRKNPDPLVREREIEKIFGSWEDVLRSGNTQEQDKEIEHHLKTGRPFGSDGWIQSLELKTGRKLTPGKGGWQKGKRRKRRPQADASGPQQ
jgi:putative transposase